MLIEELMVGDYVYNNINQVCKVYAITGLGIPYIQVDNFSTDNGCFEIGLCTEYNGIPLTKEILEKNGFDVSDKEIARYNFEENGEKLHFSLRAMYDRNGFQKGWAFFAFNVLTIIDYVHELQHALRLCGIEKQIIL